MEELFSAFILFRQPSVFSEKLLLKVGKDTQWLYRMGSYSEKGRTVRYPVCTLEEFTQEWGYYH